MHELGIAEDMLKMALENGGKHHASRITQLNIEISATAEESEDSVRFCIEMLARGTLAEGAQVEFVHIPVRLKCQDCENEFDWEAEDPATCPECSSPHLRTFPSDDFRLVSIAVD